MHGMLINKLNKNKYVVKIQKRARGQMLLCLKHTELIFVLRLRPRLSRILERQLRLVSPHHPGSTHEPENVHARPLTDVVTHKTTHNLA